MENTEYNEEENEYEMIHQMANTIDALNTNIILLNRFISSAYNLLNSDNSWKQNVEITTFDESGNIIACVKSDCSGNFIPVAHADASGNMIPCVLPHMPAGLSGPHVHINSEKKTRGFGHYPHYPYYNPYYGPYYGPHYWPYRHPYHNWLFRDNYYDRHGHVPGQPPMPPYPRPP
jgi:hypothetical protein